MAMMNRVGTFLYNSGLFIMLLILALALKNFNFENPDATGEYSYNLRMVLQAAVGLFLVYSIALIISSSASKARKKGFLFSLLIGLYILLGTAIAVFTYLSDIFKDIGEPVWKYSAIAICSILSLFAMLGLVMLQHPAESDRQKLIKAITAELRKKEEESLPFCPKCNFKVKKNWKHCPSCGSKFED